MIIFLIETICCDPHLNRLIETVQMSGHNIWFYAELTKIILVQMSGHNIWFYAELTKIIPNYHQILPLI